MSDAAVRPGDGQVFDELVGESGGFNPVTDRGWGTLAARFAAVARHTWEGSAATRLRVLDVGCGTGESRRIYAAHCASYAGVDLSHAAVRLAHRAHGEATWLQGDACELPFAPASF